VASIPANHDFLRPLANAGHHDLIDLVMVHDTRTPWPKQMRNTTHPTVFMVCDDPGNPDGLGGPDAWRCSGKIKSWAQCAIIHAAGGRPEHYAEVVLAALMVRRLVLVETTSKYALAWKERISCPTTVTIIPRTGTHPIPNAEVFH
jgi:hypothetical protein